MSDLLLYCVGSAPIVDKEDGGLQLAQSTVQAGRSESTNCHQGHRRALEEAGGRSWGAQSGKAGHSEGTGCRRRKEAAQRLHKGCTRAA